MALAPYPSGEPRWAAEAWARLVRQLHPFASTAIEFSLRPERFFTRWTSGERFAMNPFSFCASAVAVITALDAAAEQLVDRSARRTLFDSALHALAPYVYYFELGVVAHAFLWALGSRRKLSSSVAMALYSGGSLALLGHALAVVLVMGYQLWSRGPGGEVDIMGLPAGLRLPLLIVLTATFSLFMKAFAHSMGVLHRGGFVRMFFALVAATSVSGLVAGVVPLPTLSMVISLRHEGRWQPRVWLRL